MTLVTRIQSFESYDTWDGNQTWWPAPGGWCTAEVRRFTLAEGAAAPSSAVVSTAAYPSSCSVPYYFEDFRLLPDGLNGLLLGHKRTDWVLRLAPDLTLSKGRTLRQDAPSSGETIYSTEYLQGDDAAYALVNGVTFRSSQPDVYWTKAVGFQPDTLAWFSETDVSSLNTAPRHLRLQATLQGSGVLVSGPEWNNLAQVSDGLWAGWGAAPSLRVGQNIPKANKDYKDADDSARSAASPRYGILFKGHTAKRFKWIDAGPWRHATLRAVVNWDQFLQLDSTLREAYFEPVRAAQPVGGDMMMTIGARPANVSGDTSLTQDGKPLVALFNQVNDFNVHADDLVRLKTMGDAQFVTYIQALVNGGQFFIDNHTAELNQIPYEVQPDPVGGRNCAIPGIPWLFCKDDLWDGYNSNSFVRGLLGTASLPVPDISVWRYPGWTRPLPSTMLGPGQ